MPSLYKNRVFENERIAIDEIQYVDCIFRRCEIVYRGGPWAFPGCTFEQCGWSFDAAAQRTLALTAVLCQADPGLARTIGLQLGLVHEKTH